MRGFVKGGRKGLGLQKLSSCKPPVAFLRKVPMTKLPWPL